MNSKLEGKINIVFNIDNMCGYASKSYFDEDRNDRFLAIGIVDFIYVPSVPIEHYNIVIDAIGKDMVIDELRKIYQEMRNNLKSILSVTFENNLSEEDLLYLKLKLGDFFDLFFSLK